MTEWKQWNRKCALWRAGLGPEPGLLPELLPCPFCGGGAISGADIRGKTKWWFAHCTMCFASTNILIRNEGLTEEENKALAIEKWNQRRGD